MKTIITIIIALVFSSLSLIIYTQNMMINYYQQELNDKNRTELIQNVKLNNINSLKK